MNIKNISAYLLVSSFFLLSSCSYITQTKKSFKWPLESFVKFETRIYKQVCEPKDPNNFKSKCYEEYSGFTGSGSIVARTFDGVYVLTAGHMCNRDEDLDYLKEEEQEIRKKNKKNATEESEYPVRFIIKFYVYDLENFKYKAKVIRVSEKLDSCVAFVWGLFEDPLSIATERPVIGTKLYNMAAPGGFFKKNLIPLFEGRYIGEWDRYTSVYTVPAIGGSSGSPIINQEGELVGMIYARHNSFHHITISPNYKKLRRFLFSTIKKDTDKRRKEQEMERERSTLIRFGEKL